jgi:hypothetical protein
MPDMASDPCVTNNATGCSAIPGAIPNNDGDTTTL